MAIISFMIMVACILVPSLKISTAIDSNNLFHFMSDGKTLVSKARKFELGFFSPNNSTKRYLGIWYKNIPIHTVVWVANGANPINNSFGILTLNSLGNLVLSQNGTIVWHTTSEKQAQNPVATLLDSGNLVVRNEGEGNYLWQSFDYPSDTFLPGMKLGWDFRIGLERRITSWKSPNDPSPGQFYRSLVPNPYPEFYLMNGTDKFLRFGPWNGLYISGTVYVRLSLSTYTKFVSNKDELYYMFIITNDSLLTRVVINQTSYTHDSFLWNENAKTWRKSLSFPRDYCDSYVPCGPYGNCIATESPPCQCLEGFSPKSPQAWDSSDWTEGCVRNKPLNCKDKHTDEFVKFEGLKPPDTSHTWLDENIGLEDCKEKCLNNCSCTAYANSDIREGGSGCVLWFGDLTDIKQFPGDEINLYIRMRASVIGVQEPHSSRKNVTIVVTTVVAISGILLLCIYFIHKVRKSIAAGKSKTENNNESNMDDLDLPLFDLQTIKTATLNFLIQNKIGEGGFGPVYWGKLVDGQEIAVKRLSRNSRQGMTEFITEVKLIAKLQHRNLVKLLGCCIQGEEKLLVYEYMSNGSLNSFIFDHNKGRLLQWPHRFHIIFGIARGLLYLHQDSRLRIIHRDLKTSNVLLDDKLNPKISDFGLAKAFGGDENVGNTNRVVGTYGYMAPEYAVDGIYSDKSDVFSFGILLLEVICGSRNRALCHENHTFNLVGYAWTLWKEGMASQLIDTNIKESCIISEALRCIHISLLCVQQYPKDRPTMASVVRMIGSEMEMIEPKEPGYYENVSNEAMSEYVELTGTTLDGR